MRVLIAGILGGIAMYIWASVVHLSPLAEIGVHAPANAPALAAALQQNLGEARGVYVYPGMAAAAGKPGPAGLISYGHGGGDRGPNPRQLVVEFFLELFEALLLAGILSGAPGFGPRIGVAVVVGLIAGMATNFSYWNWYGFGIDYTLVNGFIELMKFVIAGVVAALVLRERKRAA